jgi:hypothetical protein
LSFIGRAHIVDRDGCPVRGELIADPLADARISTGDKRAATLQ